MKSLCIKTNNTQYIDYLFSNLSDSTLSHMCFCERKFSSYKNIIIHYTGSDYDKLYDEVSSILSSLILDYYEEQYIRKTLRLEYSYFDIPEQHEICNKCFYLLASNEEYNFNARYKLLYDIFYSYIQAQKSIVLDGFITFRLKDYQSLLNEIIENSIGKFLIEKEYNEFISILKFYINSKPSSSSIVHILYSKDKTIILDETESLISITENIYESKYISDISFSTNDYILNFLLNSLPEKIIIHYNTDSLDDFLLTLKLTFEDKITFCKDCDICRKYIPKNNSIEKGRRH